MLKAIAIALFLGAAVICVLSIALSPSYQKCVADSGQQQSSNPQQKSPSHFFVSGLVVKCIGSFIEAENAVVTAMATVVIATFTVFLVIVTGTQAKLTRRSVDIAERSLTELERPYLFILDYNWLLTEKAKADGLKCGLIYSVANGGKLPAFIKAVKYGMRTGEPIPIMQDEPPICDLLTAPLIGGGEKRLVVQSIADEGHEPDRECQIRGGMALIPSSIFKTGRMITKISIEYDGPITTGHTTTACWEWHTGKHAFTQYGGPEHNQRT